MSIAHRSRKDETFKHFYALLAEPNAAIAQKKAVLAEIRLELDREKFRFKAALQASFTTTKCVPSFGQEN